MKQKNLRIVEANRPMNEHDTLETALGTSLSNLLFHDIEHALEHIGNNDIQECENILLKVRATMHSVITLARLYDSARSKSEEPQHSPTPIKH